MADEFFELGKNDQTEIARVAASESGRPVNLLEKDIWVVWALSQLFSADFGRHLVFKGGTALSTAYDVIERFSEDVDLTYDIYALAPDMVGPPHSLDPIPSGPFTAKEVERQDSKRALTRLDTRDGLAAHQGGGRILGRRRGFGR